eukprot:NODE_336_length_10675_cov_0.185136.p7 type:complete len:118 gc:universal NODE_336_length_10675_cov_0.185136:6166-5813(-)
MKLKVSSVNRSTVFNCTAFLNDDDECWYSDAGETQFILVDFEEVKTFCKIKVQYQGGFAALNLSIKTPKISIEKMTEDTNQTQTILFDSISTQKVKLTFSNLSDLYGRLIVYKIAFE